MDFGKVCHVHDWLTVAGGAEEVLRQMTSTIPGPIYCAQFNPEKFPWAEDVHAHWISHLPLSKSKHYVYAPVLADCYKSISCRDFDTVICNSHTFAHGVSVNPESVFYCYYHTVARSVWLPEIDGRAGSGWLRKRIINRIKKLDLAASKHPTYITANSRTSADRVEKFYRRPVDEVIYPPVDTSRFSQIERTSDDEGYVLWGRQIAYKRMDLAIAAAKQLGFKLNIVGTGPMIDEYKSLAAGSTNIIFHGRLSDDDLNSLLARCRGFLFPAYEDFGIVVVEAMAAGLPVIALSSGGAAESVTESTGEWIEDQSVEKLVEAIQRFEKRTYDPAVLKARAQEFSVERFCREFKRSVERAVERGAVRNFLT